jgi:hypothetical protein
MNHDLIGIKELLKIQNNQINRIKFYTRIDNEKYLREHPEIEFIIQQFLVKLLEDQPRNCISYAGNFFHSTDFRTAYEKEIQQLLNPSLEDKKVEAIIEEKEEEENKEIDNEFNTIEGQ